MFAAPNMNETIKREIPKSEQLDAFASRHMYALMRKLGIDVYKVDPRTLLTLTRTDVLQYFRQHSDQAEALLASPKERPFHDVLLMERRDSSFVIFDMDHGIPRSEMFYDSIEEAATDFVAFTIGYGYPEGYGFKR